MIERASALKVIGRAGVGVDNVDVDAATRRGIVVANAPESTIVSAAEQTIGLIVALARNIPQAHAALKQGRWERSRWSGIELAGKTLGVLGFGRIGQQVARRALGLAMNVVAYDPFVGRDRFRELGVEQLETLEELLGAADLITLHSAADRRDPGPDRPRRDRADARRRAPRQRGARRRSSTRTRSSRRSARGSSRAPRSTCSRRSRTPGPLLELDEVVVTPHLAASTDEAQDRAGVIVAEQVVAALDGRHRHERGEHPGRRPGRPRGARPVHPARVEARSARRRARGRRAAQRSRSPRTGRSSEYDTRLLTVAALNGAFQDRVDQVVNDVNAPSSPPSAASTWSEERNARVARLHEPVRGAPGLGRGGGRRSRGRPSGPSRGCSSPARSGSAIDIEIAPHMVFVRYDDQPGRDRPRRLDVRRRRRQHREHGRLAHQGGREGADGVLDRHARDRRSWSARCTRWASTTSASSSLDERPWRRRGSSRSSR